ncbi:hypothetical protein P171DRAFT_516214 [Karstenula rhodostoma CBS 690.94]|uniref:Uncharacterized protein n=1 Tax=Karstenula rhodostoma CBS 690.94 TaxID=1392251 RepID=A0A9P4PU40_9PLEO|nr:hypothetical protein P171DRAFT_516214 [Karstenula rhodostoma CBS 690.94]
MAYFKESALRSSLVTAKSTSSRLAGRNPQRMKSECTHAELEAAATLLLLAEGPVHWERQTQQAAPVSVEPLQPSVDEGPPHKRVRFQAELSPNNEPTPTPPLTRASSIETVDSPPDHTDTRLSGDIATTVGTTRHYQKYPDIPSGAGAGVQVQSRKRTFEMDHTYATALAKNCRQPLHRLFGPGTAARPVLLKHAARATISGRHASHLAGPVANTSVANTNTDANANTITSSQPKQRKMEGFWPGSDTENGFMPFMQPDLPTADPVEFLLSQGRLSAQADINKAMFVAIEKMHSDLIRTSASNQILYEHVGSLKGRVESLEKDNTQLRALIHSLHGAKRPVPKLSLAIGKLDINEKSGLPTPSTGTLSGTTLAFPSRPTTGTGVSFPKSEISSSTGSSFAETTISSSDAVISAPRTPATITPTPVTPGSRTVLYKKDKHDLTSKLPPANLKLPLVPLTDVEIIVFFYNSSSRPIVAVRLYARGGPNVIAQIINEHRVVNPDGYKRNTCSVHCNKAVKTFIRTNGEDRKKQISDFFEAAGDLEATDAIRHEESELSTTCDFPILGLFRDLIKLPSGGQAGIFTECARWCQENQIDAQVSQAHLIADALANGTDPREKLDLASPCTQPDTAMADAADGDKNTGDVTDIVRKGDTPPSPAVGAILVQDDSSELTNLSDEEADEPPTKAGKSVKKFNVKTENASSD